jgi:hypothetical protein
MITLIGIMMPLPQSQEITIMIERAKDYVSGIVDLNDQFRESKSYPKNRYKDRLHFIQVFGKFEPDFWMLKEPVALRKLSFRAVQQVIQRNQ